MNNYRIFVLSFLLSLATVLSYSNEQDKTLLVFSANWCKYCTIAKNDMRNNDYLINELKQYSIIEIDYDTEKELAKGHNVKTLPTFIIFQNGKETKRQTGYRGYQEFLNFLK